MLNKVEIIASGSARVDILGTLAKDIEIKRSRNNNDYGILTVTVVRENSKAHWFTVFVWNQTLLNKLSGSLKKGTYVWLVGELEIVKRVSKQSTENEATFSSNTITINVREENGVSIQKDIRAVNDTDFRKLNSMPEIKTVTNNTAELKVTDLKNNKIQNNNRGLYDKQKN